MTQIWTASSGTLVRRSYDSSYAPPVAIVGRPASYTFPNGNTYQTVRYEDLYTSGDDLQAVINKVPTDHILTLPTGVWSLNDFAHNGGALDVPKTCRGIIGSGKGALGDNSGSVIEIAQDTSTMESTIPVQGSSQPCQLWIIRSVGAFKDMVFANLHVRGTHQGSGTTGHIYHGLYVYSPLGQVVVQDALVTGWHGDNGAPPGETFGLTIHSAQGSTAYHNHVLARIEADGRRTVGGDPLGCVGVTLQNTNHAKVYDLNIHDGQAGSAFVLYQTANIETWNIYTNYPTTTGGGGFNHERSTGTIHHHPTVLRGQTNHGVHFAHSCDNWSYNFDGTGALSIANGTLAIYDLEQWSNIWGNGLPYIQTYDPYYLPDNPGNVESITQDNPPVVTGSNGLPLHYKWAHGNDSLDINA